MTEWIVDWSAVGALTSTGVLFWAIWEATAASRQRRQRDIALLQALNVIVLGTHKMIEGRLLEGTTAEWTPHRIAHAILATGGLDVARRSLDSMPLHMMPTPTSVDALMAARASVENAVSAAEAMTRSPNIPLMALATPMNGLMKASKKVEAEIGSIRRPLLTSMRRAFTRRSAQAESNS